MKTFFASIYLIGIAGTIGLIAREFYRAIKMHRLVNSKRICRGRKPW